MASPNWAVRSPPCPTLSCSERAERNGHAAVQADLPRALRPESWPPRFPFAEVPSDRRAVAARRHRGSKRLFAAGARPGRRHPARAYARLGAEAKNGNIDAERRDEARSALLARVCGSGMAGRGWNASRGAVGTARWIRLQPERRVPPRLSRTRRRILRDSR